MLYIIEKQNTTKNRKQQQKMASAVTAIHYSAENPSLMLFSRHLTRKIVFRRAEKTKINNYKRDARVMVTRARRK